MTVQVFTQNFSRSARGALMTTATTLSENTHGGRDNVFTNAAGGTITLPAATGTGLRFTIRLGATVTSNSVIIKVPTPSPAIIQGGLLADQDSTDFPDAIYTAADTDTITLNGTTSGGYIGDVITLVDAATDLWLLDGRIQRTGSEASPFSAAVAPS